MTTSISPGSGPGKGTGGPKNSKHDYLAWACGSWRKPNMNLCSHGTTFYISTHRIMGTIIVRETLAPL